MWYNLVGIPICFILGVYYAKRGERFWAWWCVMGVVINLLAYLGEVLGW